MGEVEHNYNLKLMRLDAEGKLDFLREPGEEWYCRIYHGKRCRVFQGNWCNCDPDIEFVKDKTLAGDFVKRKSPGRGTPG